MSERGWLVERSIDGRPAWYRAHPRDLGEVWTYESHEALRFSREKDALAFLGQFLKHVTFLLTVTKHEWD